MWVQVTLSLSRGSSIKNNPSGFPAYGLSGPVFNVARTNQIAALGYLSRINQSVVFVLWFERCSNFNFVYVFDTWRKWFWSFVPCLHFESSVQSAFCTNRYPWHQFSLLLVTVIHTTHLIYHNSQVDSHLAPKFFKVVARLLKKSWSPFSKTEKTFFYAVGVLDRPSKIRLGKRSLTYYKEDIRMDDIQRSSSPKSKMASSYCSSFGNKLNGKVCRGFIFENLFHPLYLLVGFWWNILVSNLATKFQNLVAKEKNLVALAPLLGAISRPAQNTCMS